jgi:hypothetical protein
METATVRVSVNTGRVEAMMQALRGRLKRAPRWKRPAIFDAGIREITQRCVRVRL